MENSRKRKAFRVLCVITTPKLAEKTSDMLKRENLPIQYRFNAEGTASSEIMNMLGLGSTDKCVLATMLPRALSGVMLRKLHTELKLDTVNSGIAFTIPLSGANNLVLRMIRGTDENNDGKEDSNMSESKHALIAAIVNLSFSGDVMEAAKSAGARGGTVIHSRFIENEEAAKVWGMDVQDEKEIVMIIAEAEDRLPIMQAISEKCGMHSEAKGVVISMPIDSAIGL